MAPGPGHPDRRWAGGGMSAGQDRAQNPRRSPKSLSLTRRYIYLSVLGGIWFFQSDAAPESKICLECPISGTPYNIGFDINTLNLSFCRWHTFLISTIWPPKMVVRQPPSSQKNRKLFGKHFKTDFKIF